MQSDQPRDGIHRFPVELQGESYVAALGRAGDEFVLVLASEVDRATRESLNGHVTAVSVLVEQDPFPGLTMDGRPMIWVKTYSENLGLLEQLEKARVLRPTGTTIKQGLVSYPSAVVVLGDREIAQRCAYEGCQRFESVETTSRFKRCSSCKRRYYCSSEHQHSHWARHKRDCKALAAGQYTQVEKRRRTHDELPQPEHVEELADGALL